MMSLTSDCDRRHTFNQLTLEVEDGSNRRWIIIRRSQSKAEFPGNLLHREVVGQDFRIYASQLLVSCDLYDTAEQFRPEALVLACIRYQHGNFPFVFSVSFDQSADSENAMLARVRLPRFRDNRHLAVVVHKTNAHETIMCHSRPQAKGIKITQIYTAVGSVS